MPQIGANTLMVVIQVLDEKIRSIKALVDQADENDEDIADVEEELLIYSKVALELRKSYEEAFEDVGNLPPYSELMRT